MNFSILTPSFNQLAYLKRCVASISDQTSEPVDHRVIDGGSTDGTLDFLKEYPKSIARSSSGYSFFYTSEPDRGMYDALNKGLNQCLTSIAEESKDPQEHIIAWLNCDEQYLPGALHQVAHCFKTHPNADFIYGDALMIRPDGRLLTCRKNPPLRPMYVLADHLYTQSAALFFRSTAFTSGLRFNPAWKAVGDCDLILRLFQAGFRAQQLKSYLAACVMTGSNISQGPSGVTELEQFRKQSPLLFQHGRPLFNALRYIEKALRNGYRQAVPFEYELWLEQSTARTKQIATTASCRFQWGEKS
ncbi:MAG: glycosyltransferase [Kiritimatiellaceae bacterium]|nr:glycosyltransferase [Kiritimatiellaceae bacterium]